VSKGPKRVKIAQITFAFHNAEVIAWLRKRGGFIQNEKWKDLKEMNKTITEGLRDEKTNLLDKLQTPCSIFATFETEEGY
jgi:hypothetical protein